MADNIPQGIDAVMLRQLFSYDPETGVFVRRVATSQNTKAGHIAGTDDGMGYLQIRTLGKVYRAHRLAWLYMTGKWPSKGTIDHINGDRSDNRFANLRDVTQTENCLNQKTYKNNKSGAKGVFFNKHRMTFSAAISQGGQRFVLGTFGTYAEAKASYDGAAMILRGELHRAE